MEEMKIKIHSLTQTSDSEYMKSYRIDYTQKEGKEKSWYTCSRKKYEDYERLLKTGKNIKSDAAAILAYHIEKKGIVIIKQLRIPINSYIYEIPAGLVDQGEPPEITCKRELKEETGLDMIELISSQKNLFTTPGFSDETLDIYTVTCKGEITDEYTEGDEDIEAFIVSREEASKMLGGKLEHHMDIKTYFCLKLFAAFGEKIFGIK